MTIKRSGIDCREIIKQGKLHYIVWDRGDSKTHERALFLVKELVDSGAVVLLRPAGRKEDNYQAIQEWFRSHRDERSQGMQFPNEMWVHVKSAGSNAVWKRMEDFASTAPASLCCKSIREPAKRTWQPLSDGIYDCQYADGRFGGAEIELAKMQTEQIAWLLKVIWFCASQVLVEQRIVENQVRYLDILNNGKEVVDILSQILADFRPSDYGIEMPDTDTIDPTFLGASHLAAFAVNAFFSDPQCSLTGFLQSQGLDRENALHADRPHLHGSRKEYLDWLRAIILKLNR